ncbi:GTP pyrophosphokinase family protein [Gordonia alkaliphila]|uniref:GTP pyrophosphokinase family protein n=1 Tax=Gordonia alkaliphila TaxID=1053547 RepID=UPI001FF2CE42|nr:GTP pyrophosphokinase family protein [Gordonia alkaliphila]MCK0439204.1 GTP pyrophosphokinase family protein [Gordonia alkaliphila]
MSRDRLQDGPSYSDVMEWHSDLCADIAASTFTHPWESLATDDFDIAARAKTFDTLKQKLVREDWMTLNQVQDLAGVRVDGDFSLRQQTAFAHEIVHHFAGAAGKVKDLRESPHSGYRAVHVWLRLPAGRVEVQIRTRGQNAWANAYEQLADTVGRQIRYGEDHEDPSVQEIVEYLHAESASLAALENALQELLDIGDGVDRAMELHTDRVATKIAELANRMEDFQRKLEIQPPATNAEE